MTRARSDCPSGGNAGPHLPAPSTLTDRAGVWAFDRSRKALFFLCFAMLLAAFGPTNVISKASADSAQVTDELRACLLREHALTEKWRFQASFDCFAAAIQSCPIANRDACEAAATAAIEAEFRDALSSYYSDQLMDAGDRQEEVQREQDYSRLLLRHVTEKADLECRQHKEVDAFLGPLSVGNTQFACNAYRSLRIAHFILGRFDHHAVYKYIRKSGDK